MRIDKNHLNHINLQSGEAKRRDKHKVKEKSEKKETKLQSRAHLWLVRDAICLFNKYG